MPNRLTKVAAAIAIVAVAGINQAAAATIWKPTQGTSWQIQLQGTLNTSVAAAVYEVDGFDTSASQVASLKAKGKRVICYFSAGSAENWRPDYSKFPASVKGRNLDGWAGEKWLDIRAQSILLPIMESRIKMCRDKGFDAVDPDNVDAYTYGSRTGFPLTSSHQLSYNRALASLAHKYGLGIGLKNDLNQVVALQPSFDFAVNESCVVYNECTLLNPFLKAGKAVLHIEYKGYPGFCSKVPKGFSSIKKNLDLGAARSAC